MSSKMKPLDIGDRIIEKFAQGRKKELEK